MDARAAITSSGYLTPVLCSEPDLFLKQKSDNPLRIKHLVCKWSTGEYILFYAVLNTIAHRYCSVCYLVIYKDIAHLMKCNSRSGFHSSSI